MDSLFATVLGLPMHPLVVHSAVVLLPLSAFSLIAAFLVPWWRRRYAGLSLAGLTIALGVTFVAKESGEWLGHQIGTPEQHEEWAEILLPVTAAFWVLAVVWYVLARRAARVAARPADDAVAAPGAGADSAARGGARGGLAATVAGALMSLGAVASLVLVALVGHSGAEATWSGELSGGDGSAAAAEAPAGAAYTLAQVREHASTTSCWAAVSGSVYDLTTWIGQHPGGAAAITGLCGTDATAAFTAQHGDDQAPQQRLAGFRIGALSG